jgi:Tol biopolymer transport system component
LAISQGGSQDIWIADLGAGTRTRLTSEPAPDTQPVWSRDGQFIFYDSYREPNRPAIIRRAASGASGEQIVHTFPSGSPAANLSDTSPDAKLLAYHQNGPKSTDLWMLDISKPDAEPQLLLQTEFQEIATRFSTDGKWYLYRSNESGRNEIYAQAVPGYGAPPGKYLISHEGSLGMARWRKDGREVYFLAANGAVMAADVTTSPAFKSGMPHKLFDVPQAFRALFVRNPGTLVDITPDGQRFLFAVPLQDAGAVPFEVTTDFRASLAK